MPGRILQNERAIQLVAEDKLRSATAAGEFANLPGMGQPLALLDEPYDPFWWIRRKLRREQLLPRPTGSISGTSLDPVNAVQSPNL